MAPVRPLRELTRGTPGDPVLPVHISQWGTGNDFMQERKVVRSWGGHSNGWKGSSKGSHGWDWLDPRLIQEAARAQV